MSIVKRLAKFLFKKNDLSEVNIEEVSEYLQQLLVDSFAKFFNSNGETLTPFIVLRNMSKFSP